MKIVADGRHAVLVECNSLVESIAVGARLRALPPPGVEDIVPAARTVLVRGLGSTADLAAAVDERLRGWQPAAVQVADTGPPIEIVVRYDGADLADIAGATGLEPAEVIRLHSSADYTVAFCGFAPGFAYLVGLPAALVRPRRDTPRTSVPAGSVAIAGELSAVYPTSSPGGWHLLGHTDRVLFDPERDPPAVLVPGAHVRFEPG
ncbi:MAG: allophanate hydrolase [Ilumatobacteraceae bacterium]|nr:allophanate hydrolase [Ilumatobacteraceae bacterium]